MKKAITFLMLLIGLMAFSQGSSINIDLQHDFRIGCCADDTDNHPDYPNCIYPDFQQYYTNGDAKLNDFDMRLSNGIITVNGDFYTGNGDLTFSPNCESQVIVTGDLIVGSGNVEYDNEGMIVYGNVNDYGAKEFHNNVLETLIDEPEIYSGAPIPSTENAALDWVKTLKPKRVYTQLIIEDILKKKGKVIDKPEQASDYFNI